MSENKSNKKLIIILAIALLVAGLFIIKPWNKKPVLDNEETSCENETVEDDNKDPFNLTYSGKTVEYNAYDFIIEKMSQAQYWTHDQFQPKYFLNHSAGDHIHDETIINGSGWILYDEDTASFVRGCEGRLIINFSNFSAQSNEMFSTYDYRYPGNLVNNDPIDIVNDEPQGSSKEVFYFNTDYYAEFFYGGATVFNYDSNMTDRHSGIGIKEEIQYTLEFYENVFSTLGIPLLNQPKGTLASYKNVTIDVPVELIDLKYYDRYGDGKINSPFDERVGFDYYWERNEDNTWLDDYRDVLNKRFPEAIDDEMKVIYDDNDEEKKYNYYAPVFLCVADRDDHLWEPDEIDARWGVSSFLGTWSEWDMDSLYAGTGYYETMSASPAIATYWLKPLYKYIFGFNGVYFVDEYKVNDEDSLDKIYDFLTEDEFKEGIGYGYEATVTPVYNKGDYTSSFGYSPYSTRGDLMITHMKKLCEKYGVESPYSEDFVYNLHMIYSKQVQNRLGLR